MARFPVESLEVVAAPSVFSAATVITPTISVDTTTSINVNPRCDRRRTVERVTTKSDFIVGCDGSLLTNSNLYVVEFGIGRVFRNRQVSARVRRCIRGIRVRALVLVLDLQVY